MTNTRITDPEVFEQRYPVLVHQFQLRDSSGGEGKFTGGDGVIREIEFRSALVVSILSERRATSPYGLKGGKDGERGKNYLKLASSGRIISLGGKNTIKVTNGDRLIIYTPGGGGFGVATDNEHTIDSKIDEDQSWPPRRYGGGSVAKYQETQESA